MTAQEHAKKVNATADWISARMAALKPTIGIIMGSGLSEAVPDMSGAVRLAYGKIPGFPKSTVQGHAGELILGEACGKDVVIMRGRFHYYEGNDMADIALPIRVLGRIGVRAMIVTSAVGSLYKKLCPGDLVVLKDHINLFGHNPLRGIYDSAFGKMFPDMSEPYDKALRKEALKICGKLGIRAGEGVYTALGGPSYETPAEIRALRLLGADVAGMSVIPEVITARQLGIKVLGLSWVTNFGSGILKEPLSHADVLTQGRKMAKKVKALLETLLDSELI